MMQQITDPLELTILILENISDKKISGRRCEGILNQDQSFDYIRNKLEAINLLISEEITTRHIEFHLPPDFFKDFDELFSAPSRRISIPANFYIADIKYLHKNEAKEKPLKIKQYIQAIELFNGLRNIAHEIPKGNDVDLLFIQNEKILVSSTYLTDDLKDLINLESFLINFINSDIHKDQKSTIIKSSITDFFKNQSSIKFSDLLINFDELFESINNSYQLYVSEFSFLKIKTEIEKEKLEFTTKLNKVFSDIQNQLLAIPAALILVGGQMEQPDKWTIKNFTVWAGALTFSLLMNLLIKNQRHTLNAIKSEIDQQKKLIQTKHKTVANKFIDIYEQLDKRYDHQHKLIGTIDFLVALSLLVATYLLIFFSTTIYLSFASISLGFIIAGLLKIEIYFKSTSIAKNNQ